MGLNGRNSTDWGLQDQEDRRDNKKGAKGQIGLYRIKRADRITEVPNGQIEQRGSTESTRQAGLDRLSRADILMGSTGQT
jgi:hypothetical protein